jgi:hypothetical protein
MRRADAGGREVHLLRHGLRIGERSFTDLTGALLATTSDGDAARPATASYCDRIEVGLRFLA